MFTVLSICICFSVFERRFLVLSTRNFLFHLFPLCLNIYFFNFSYSLFVYFFFFLSLAAYLLLFIFVVSLSVYLSLSGFWWLFSSPAVNPRICEPVNLESLIVSVLLTLISIYLIAFLTAQFAWLTDFFPLLFNCVRLSFNSLSLFFPLHSVRPFPCVFVG